LVFRKQGDFAAVWAAAACCAKVLACADGINFRRIIIVLEGA
jgi:hypothetical protein